MRLAAAVDLRLTDQLQSLKIVLRPMGLPLDHAFQGFGCEGISRRVKRDGDSAAVRVLVKVVGTGATVERKPIANQHGDNLPCRQAA
jgi:hypothetical protein